MRRRRYLRAAAAGSIGALAGCVTGFDGDAGASDASDSAAMNLELPVPREEMHRGASTDAIPAIVDPVFGEDWSGISMEVPDRLDPRSSYEIEPRLEGNDPVVGVARDGAARAYPLRVLNWHEVVNDRFGGPLLVSYCPLCGSGLTAVGRAAGEATRFGVSGLLWRNDLVMYDGATASLWSQLAATAINGELTGETLEVVPSTLTTWGEWRRSHPGTVVLRPPPESDTLAGPSVTRDYRVNPYAGYQRGDAVGIGGDGFEDDRLHPKTTVIGVVHDGAARAYPVDRIERETVINDAVGGLPVVVSTAAGTPVAYVRTIDGRATGFEPAGERHLRAGGSRWRRATGEAVDGPHQGRRLPAANEISPLFWFAWLDFHPETTVYGER